MKFLIGKINRNKRSKVKLFTKNKSKRNIISVKRTNKNIYVNLLDLQGNIIESYSSLLINDKDRSELSGIELAKLVGRKFSDKCKSNLKIADNKFIFRKGSYKYFGRVKALAEACREANILI